MVIIAMLNEAQNSVFDLFIESFKVGDGTSRLLNHLVVLALDREAFEHCGALHSHCYFPNHTGDFQGRESTETMMTARQIEFSRQVLELAYSFIYTVREIKLCSFLPSIGLRLLGWMIDRVFACRIWTSCGFGIPCASSTISPC